MYRFNIYNPVKVLFGIEEIREIPSMIKNYGNKILFLYSESFRKKGSYCDALSEMLVANGIEIIYMTGVMSNPTEEMVERIAEICRKESLELILAVGGGSVIDCAKAASACMDGTCIDLLYKRRKITGTLPVIAVPTTIGTGSEMNSGGLISVRADKKKISFGHPLLFPKAAFIVPEYTRTQPIRQTLAGCADAMFHIMESNYFTYGDKMEMNLSLMECIMKQIVTFSVKLAENPENMEARANLAWISSWALNGYFENGTGKIPICHAMEHELSGYYDIPHNLTMAVIVPKWLRYVEKSGNRKEIARFGRMVFGIEAEDNSKAAIAAIECLENFLYDSLNLFSSLKSFKEIKIDDFEKMAEHIAGQGTLSGLICLGKTDIINIYMDCYMI